MSVRKGIVLLVALSALLFLAGCGSSNGVGVGVAPPSGSFSVSNLNGTYVFSVSGTDEVNGTPYAIVGSFTANGNGGITGGSLDINDVAFAESSPVVPPVANASINSNSTYKIGADGRGQAVLVNSTLFGNITLDFVLSSSSQGLVTEFDSVGTGSGTLDLQTAGTTPVGSYAFSFSGADFSPTGGAYATVGNFTIGSGGAIAGLEDFNVNTFGYPDQALGGQLVVGPSSSPSTTLSTNKFGALIFDVYAIDATHLKFIEMDTFATLAGDAYSQTTTTIPAETMAFTLEGIYPADTAFAGGGFMTTDGSTGITGTEDVTEGESVSVSPLSFTASYGSTETGRYTLTNFAGGSFTGSSVYAAYPSSGGLLLLEIDDSGIAAGAGYAQSSTTFAASQGYGLNLSGLNLSAGSEVDDIAEFAANSTGTTVTGLIDENSVVEGPATLGQVLSGTYTPPDSNGRGSILVPSADTLNGGLLLTFYTVDGTNFPFIETDGGQVSAGIFIEQNPSSVSPAVAKSHMFVVRPLIRPHAAKLRK